MKKYEKIIPVEELPKNTLAINDGGFVNAPMR